jgi:hypothetical protein
MLPAGGQFDNVVSLDAKRAEKASETKASKSPYGPIQAGIVKTNDKPK